MPATPRVALFPLACTLALAPAAPAQTGPKGEISEQGLIDGVDFSLKATGEVAFQTNLRAGPGDVTVYRAGLNLALLTTLAENWRGTLELSQERSWYNFHGATTIIPGTDRPFNEMQTLRLTPGASHVLSKEWSYSFGGIFDFSFERDADVGDSFTAGGFIGVRYAFSDTFALSFGALAKTRIEKSTLFLPLLGVEWKINDKVQLATRGLGGTLTYQVNDRWSFQLFGEYEAREYRLDGTGPDPDGVIRDRRAPVGVGLTWKPTGQTEISLRGGAIVYQQFRADNSTGTNLTEVRAEPTGFVSLSGVIRF